MAHIFIGLFYCKKLFFLLHFYSLAINQAPDKLIKLDKHVLRGQSALLQRHLEGLGLKVLLCPILPNSKTEALISQFLANNDFN